MTGGHLVPGNESVRRSRKTRELTMIILIIIIIIIIINSKNKHHVHYFHVSAVDVKFLTICICKFYSSSRREIIKFAFLIKGRLHLVSSKAVVLPRLAVYAVRTFNDSLMTLSAVFTADHFSIKS